MIDYWIEDEDNEEMYCLADLKKFVDKISHLNVM